VILTESERVFYTAQVGMQGKADGQQTPWCFFWGENLDWMDLF